MKPLPRTTLLITLAALAAWVIPGATSFLQYDRATILGGQLWRLVTGHLTHWSADQLFWDGAVFAALGAACERRNRASFRLGLALSVVAVTGLVWVALPGLNLYRGLSGIDSALFTLLGAQIFAERVRERHWGGAAALGALWLGFVAKVAYEQLSGATLFVADQAGMVPIAAAHLAGAAAGAAAYGLEFWKKWFKTRKAAASRSPILPLLRSALWR